MMSRIPIRVRLTIAFAATMTLLLVAGGIATYLAVRSQLDETIETSMTERFGTVASLALEPGSQLPEQQLDPEEGFAQILSPGGEVLDRSGGPTESPLDAAMLAAAGERRIGFDREVPGVEATARVMAGPAEPGAPGPIVVVGQSLGDRDETLSGLAGTLAIGGAVGILVASLLGYLLAGSGLRPVEAMRRQAASISLEHDGGSGKERLPLPPSRDEIRRLGVTLNEMLDRLEASFERERRFVADASHQLRTPIAVLKAEIEAALRIGGAPPEMEASLAAALEECDELAQLAEDLLLIARAGESGIALDRTPVALDQLLGRVRERFEQRATLGGRRLLVEAGGEASVPLDPQRVGQALGNLVDNALRYGAGTVTLGARAGHEAVVLFVRDEGSGFPPELRGKEFERFSRGSVAQRTDGSGLGLAIVAAIAEAHGGEAVVEPAGPTEVRVVLPRPAPRTEAG